MESMESATQKKPGAVDHILRQQFADLFSSNVDLSLDQKGEATGLSDEADLVPAKSPGLPAEELRGIDARRSQKLADLDGLQESLAYSAKVADQFDRDRFAELRKLGLVQGYEIPLERSPPRTAHQRNLPATQAGWVVSPSTVLHAVDKEIAVRTGQVREGEDAPDFYTTAGEPRYLASTAGREARVESTAKQAVETVGGFGPAFHRTGQPGLVDIPSTSGHAGVSVSRLPTGLTPHSVAGASSGLRKKAKAGMTGPAGPGLVKGYRTSSGAPSSSAVEGKAVSLEEQLERDMAQALDREQEEEQDEGQEEHGTAGPLGATGRLRATVSSAAAAVPEGVAGVRGEGLRASVTRTSRLEYARQHAGAGTAGALSERDIGANAAIADRMQRPQQYTRASRHDAPPSRSSLLTAGAGRKGSSTAGQPLGEVEARAATEHMAVRSVSPPKVLGHVNPGRKRRGASTATAEGQAGEQQWQTLETGRGPSARTGLLGLNAALEHAQPAFLPSRGGLQGLRITREAVPGASLPSEGMAGCFSVSPSAVRFPEYEAGATHTMVVTVRNVDSVMRHLRVLPPATRVFRCDVSAFPGAAGPEGLTSARGRDGLLLPTGKAGSPIAPGMAVKLTITFTPPTPTPFTDSVTLVTEAGQYSLPLLASVVGPELTLPLTLHIGACMKFDVLTRHIPAKNVGSKATFRLLPAEVFDAVSEGLLSLDLGVSLGRPSLSGGAEGAGDGSAMETLCSLTVPAPDGEFSPSDGGEGSATSTCGLRRVHADSVELWSGPFRVWPTTFELARGQSIDLHVLYRPTQHGVHARRLALVGSDGSVFSYTLTAECAPLNVSIASLQAITLPEPLTNGVQYAPVAEYGSKGAYDRLLHAPTEEAAPDFLSAALGSALAAVVTGADRDAAQLTDPSRAAPAPRSEVRNPAQRLRFDDIHPGTSQSKSITVRNDSPLPVRYSWALLPQACEAPKLPVLHVLGLDPKQGHMRLLNKATWGAELQHGDPSDVGREASAQLAPVLPPFHVQPAEGVLQGYSTATFAVTFAPTVTARAGDGSPAVAGGSSVQSQPCSWTATAVLSVHDVPVDPSEAAAARQAAAAAASEERIQAQARALRRASKPGTWTPALTPRAGGSDTPVASAAADRHGRGGMKSRPSSAAAEVASMVVLKQDELGLTALTMGIANAPDSRPSSSSSPGSGPFVGSMTAFAVDSSPRPMEGQGGAGDMAGAERELGPGGPRPALSRGAYGQVDTIRVTSSHTVDSVVRHSSIAVSVLALHGCSKAAEVVLEPSSIQVPGPLLPAHISAGATRLVNNGDGPVSFVVLEQGAAGTAAEGCDVTVEPRAGVLGARQSVEVHATFTGRQPGEHTAVFPVHMFYGAEVGQAAQAVLDEGGHLSAGLVSALRAAHIAQEEPPAPSVELTVAPASPRAPGTGGGADAPAPATAAQVPAGRATPAVPTSHYISRSTPFNGGAGGGSSPEGAAPGSPISILVSNGLAELVHMCSRASAAVQQLTVRGTVRYPNVAWSAARLDAGLLGCERTATHTLRVVNVDDCPVRWVAHRVTSLPGSGEDTHAPEATCDSDRRSSNLYVHPASGLLGPGEACDVSLAVDTAITPEHLEGVLRVVAVPFGDDTAERAAARRQAAVDVNSGRARGQGEVEALLNKPYELAELPVANPRLWGRGQAHPLHPALLPVPSFLRLTCEVQAPLVSLSCTAWKLGTLFVGMPVRRQVTLTNLCDLPVDFSWDPYVAAKPPLPIEDPGWELVDAALQDTRRLLRSDGKKRLFPSLLEVAFEDGCSGGKGSLGPRESVTVTLCITGKHPGSVSSLLAVDVPGMQEPLGLALSAAVLGVTARYSVVDDGTGKAVPVPPALVQSSGSPAPPGEGGSQGSDAQGAGGPSPGIVDTSAAAASPTLSLQRPASTGTGSTPSHAVRSTTALLAAARARESRDSNVELGSVEVDGELEQDPTVLAMREAQARAAALGATHARLPALQFGNVDTPLSTHARKSYTLHILNMSGIPTTFTAAVSSYAAAEPASLLAAQAAVRSESSLATPSGHGHNSTFITPRGTPWLGGLSSPDAGLNWPALYDAAERISAVDKVAAARTAVRRGFVPAHVAQGIAESLSLQTGSDQGEAGKEGRSTTSRSLSPPGRAGGRLVPRPARYGVQHVPPAGVGRPLGPPFAFAVAPTSVVTPQGTLAYGGSLASHLAVTGGAAHGAHGQGTGRRPSTVAQGEAPVLALPSTVPAGDSTGMMGTWSPRGGTTGGSPSASRSGLRTKSASPSRPRRPRLFLTASHETTQKFASAAGRQASEQQEVERLHRASLATGQGLSLQVFPRQGALPPFGHAAVQVAAVGDFPGEYSDTLTVHVEGCEPISVPLTAVLTGCPLTLLGHGATLGLADEGAAGSTGPTLAFGDCPQGGAALLKTVTLENSSPLDAHVLLTVGPDAAPAARFGPVPTTTTTSAPPPPPLQQEEQEAPSRGGASTTVVEAGSSSSSLPGDGPGSATVGAPPPPEPVAAEDGKEGEEGEAAPQPTVPPAETGAPVLDRAAILAALSCTDLPFTVQPQVLLIPAHGKVTVRVAGTPRLMHEGDVTLSSALGWEGRWLHYLRARIVGHAVYTPAGQAPPSDLLRKLGSLGPLVDAPEGPWLDVTAKDAEASDRALALWTDVDAGRPAQRPLAQPHALVLHTSIRPFLPALTLDKHSLADGKPWIKFSVWSTALEDGASGSAVGSGIAAVKSTKGIAGAGAAGRGSMSASGQLAYNAGLHPSCAQQVVLTNSSGAELPFFLTVDGPFVLLKAETSAPPHPITRLDLLSGPSSPGDVTSQGRMAALFPVDTMPPGTRVHSLPPGCSLAVTLAFSPEAGRSMRATAAQMFFTSHGAAASTALSATAHLTGTGPAASASATLSMTGGREGTVTLGGTGGLAGARPGGGSSSDVQGLIAASITRLKGEYTGMLRATYSTGATQEIGLRAEVLRPAVQANPGGIAFGVVRAGGGARVAALALTNPTAVTAEWAIRHVPAPTSPLAARVQPGSSTVEVDWRSLGLDPSHPLWADSMGQPGEAIHDEPGVFAFTALSGALQGPTVTPDTAAAASLRHSDDLPLPATIDVRFAPARPGLYQSRYRVGVKGGEAVEILLRGRGTLEEIEGTVHADVVADIETNVVGPQALPLTAGSAARAGAVPKYLPSAGGSGTAEPRAVPAVSARPDRHVKPPVPRSHVVRKS